MEGLSRIVAESLARNGFDRPLDYRRLHWSRWFRCESPHSLLFVPSKPGVFALAEEIMGPGESGAMDGRRMLAVLQFCEDEDMAFVLDRMFSRNNPMRARLASGRCFVRFVAIEDEVQRRSIAGALNQWLISSSEKPSGIGAHFATSLELTNATEDARAETTHVDGGDSRANAGSNLWPVQAHPPDLKPHPGCTSAQGPVAHLDSGSVANLHCPTPLPSGF
jgi:hypothetical protein